MARTLAVLLLGLVLVGSACAQSTKSSWRETGHSWRDGGRQFLRALGFSIAGEGSPKEEWKQTGEELREAGKDTAESVGKSVDPAQGR